MRILALPIITDSSPQVGMRHALQAVACEYLEIDWFRFWNDGRVNELRKTVIDQARDFCPDIAFLQLQTPGVLTPDEFEAIPGKKILWCGDLRDELPRWAIDSAPYVDVTMMNNRRDVESLQRLGFRAEFVRLGFDPKIFNPEGPKREGQASAASGRISAEYRPDPSVGPEIVAMMNNYGKIFPRGPIRKEIVDTLDRRYGKRFALHGNGWTDHDQWLKEEEEAAVYRSCRIAINVEHYHVPGFCSDRIFRATGSGACLVSDRFMGFEECFTPEEGVFCSDVGKMCKRIDELLDDETKRAAIAAAGCQRAHRTHTWDCRIKEMMELAA